MHMTFVKLHVHIKHDACTVQFQAWHIHCPISAQIGLVITNHIKEFYYSFDNNQKVLDTIIVELTEHSPITVVTYQAKKIWMYDCTTVQPTIQDATFNMRGQLYHRHTNTTALSSSLVVSALSFESDNPGSSPGWGKALSPWDVQEKNASSTFRLG